MFRFVVLALMIAGSFVYSLDQRPVIQGMINRAIREKKAELVLAPGEYRMSSNLMIKGARSLRIVATGVTFIITDFKNPAMRLRDCSKLTIKGLAIDYDPLPFTQATITEMSAGGGEVAFKVHKGYPLVKGRYAVGRMHAFDSKTLRLKMDVKDIYGKMAPGEDGVAGRFKLSDAQPALAVGDYVVFNIRKVRCIDIGSGTQGTTFEDVTIFSAPGIGFVARFSLGGDVYRRVRIMRGKKPAGADKPRLFSTSADGLNYAYVRSGIVMDECDFSFMGDDSVNFHGPALPVVRVDEDGTLWTVRPHGVEGFADVVRSGDEVRIIAPGNFAITARDVVESITVEKSPAWVDMKKLAELFPSVARRHKKLRVTAYGVRLKKNAGVRVGDFMDIPCLSAQNFEIRKSYFHDHRARGLRIMTRNGKIVNNRFERIKQSAISIGPEYSNWRESGWPENIEVRGNKLIDTAAGVEAVAKDYYTPGAISLFSRRDDTSLPVYSGIRNVRIIDNVISGSAGAGVFVNSARDCEVKGNSISNVLQRDVSSAGANYGIKVDGAVTVLNSKDITVENNKIK